MSLEFQRFAPLAAAAILVAGCHGSTTAVMPPQGAAAIQPAPQDSAVRKNLLANPSFTKGNRGFVTQYSYVKTIGSTNQYTIGKDPCKDAVPSFSWACYGDHTSGHGYMMEVNASTTPGKIFWSEKIKVEPNTTYLFAFWGAGVDTQSNNSPAVIKVVFNGVAAKKTFTLPAVWNGWQHYELNWASNKASSVTISLVDKNTAAAYNDFALDDLFFG